MSARERLRLETVRRVARSELTLAKAAQVLELSYRQMKRICRRFKEEGDGGVVHRHRGRASNRQADIKVRTRALDLYRAKYGDFGPTLAAEYLAKDDGLEVAVETLRRWLSGVGLWEVHRPGVKHRSRRARKEHVGEMIQMDGSWHDWFEGRRAWATLMVMIDDATNRTYARFFEQETTEAAMGTFGRYARRYGLPQSLYVDRDSIYRPGREETVDDRLSGVEPVTQFGRAMQALKIRLILANSPQAKGRVERRNAVFQDRLVKALRLAGIDDLASANEFLEKSFLAELNRRFTFASAKASDLHRQAPPKSEMDRILAIHEKRLIQNDWTLQWNHRCFQLTSVNRTLALTKKKVEVIEKLNGEVLLYYRGRKLTYTELAMRPSPTSKRKAKQPPRTTATTRPKADHPWRGRKG